MMLTVDIPEALNRRLESEKRKTGLSKSHLVRMALQAAFLEVKTTMGKRVQ